jgi:hypothetical protein
VGCFSILYTLMFCLGMTQENRLRRFAVLIDADNASAAIADNLFEEIARFGDAIVRRIYGDFSEQRLTSWSSILQRHAISAQQHFAYTKGKNASDIALVIDAMDLLRKGTVEGFCLVSSDSDFTRLASRLREDGADVVGFGEQKTPESFRQACRRFIYTENLRPAAAPSDVQGGASSAALKSVSAAIPLLRKVISQIDGEDGWANLGEVGSQLVNLEPDFDPRTYGYSKLSELVRKTGAFDLEQKDGKAMRIRKKVVPRGGRAPQRAT